MVSGASLLSTIPTTTQNWQTQSKTPIIASVRVGDVVGEEPKQDNRSFITKYIDKLKENMIQKRIKKLESIPPEKRTPAQQAEYDANKQSMNYMV